MSNPIVRLLFKVIKAYNVPITRQAIERAVLTHPGFPSMQCISDALDEWKVKHVVMKLSMEKLQRVDVPVIAQLKRGEFVWVKQIADSKVHYWSASNKEKIVSCDQFEREWSGIALALQSIDNAGEPDYREKRRKEIVEGVIRYGIAGGLAVLLMALICFSWINDGSLSLLSKLLFLIINTAGVAVCYLLIRQEKRQSSNRLIQKFCKAGAHVDCNTVTRSTKPQHFRRRYL